MTSPQVDSLPGDSDVRDEALRKAVEGLFRIYNWPRESAEDVARRWATTGLDTRGEPVKPAYARLASAYLASLPSPVTDSPVVPREGQDEDDGLAFQYGLDEAVRACQRLQRVPHSFTGYGAIEECIKTIRALGASPPIDDSTPLKGETP